MISLQGAVMIVVYLLVAAVVFGLLWWAVQFVASQFAAPPLFIKVAKVVLVLAVLVLINVLLGFAGHPLVRWQ